MSIDELLGLLLALTLRARATLAWLVPWANRRASLRRRCSSAASDNVARLG
jgi:hypothetical protein